MGDRRQFFIPNMSEEEAETTYRMMKINARVFVGDIENKRIYRIRFIQKDPSEYFVQWSERTITVGEHFSPVEQEAIAILKSSDFYCIYTPYRYTEQRVPELVCTDSVVAVEYYDE